MLNKLTSGTQKLLACGALVLITSVLLAYYLHKSAVLFPSSLNVHIKQTTSELLVLYYDTGKGFRESERAVAKLSGSSETAQLDLPFKHVQRIRLDTDNDQQSIDITKLCFTSIWNEQCWEAQQLYSEFELLNGIAGYTLQDDALQIKTQGKDPHFSFKLDIPSAHLSVAQVNRPTYLLCAFLIASLLLAAVIVFCLYIWPWIVERFIQAKANGFYISLGPAAALVSFLSIFISGIWLIVYKSGAHIYLPLMGLLLLLVCSRSEQGFNLASYVRNTFSELTTIDWKQLICVSLLIMLPASYLMFATWGQDFPNVGDHEYHFWGNHVAYYAVERNKEYILLALAGLLFALLIGRVAAYVLLAALLLICAGAWDTVNAVQQSNTQGIFARYPGGSRLLTYPFVHWSFLYDWDSPLNVGRLVNYLAIPVWLFILRPLIIGKWPGWALLPFSFLFFYQTETAYFFTSAYLDMWCLVFIMLALEKLLIDDNQNAYLKACLLLAIACAFKEPAVFIIPWFWLAGRPWRLLSEKNGFKKIWDAMLVGLASILPFIVYYLSRKASGVSRYTYKGTEYFLTEAWFAEMANRMHFHFGTAGIALLGLLAIAWVYYLLSSRWKAYRVKLICILGAAISLICLFNLDQGGVAFTGYFRFYLPIYLLFLAPAFLITKESYLTENRKAMLLAIFCLLAIVGNGPRLVEYMSSTQQHDAARNFTEHYDAPIFLPIRSLIEQAEQDKALYKGSVDHIYVNHVTAWNQPDFAYPQIDRKYNLRMYKEIMCECSEQNKAVLAPFVYYAGLNKDIKNLSMQEIDESPQQIAKYAKRWHEVNAIKPQCLAKLKSSCDYYKEERVGDEVVGAIGILK